MQIEITLTDGDVLEFDVEKIVVKDDNFQVALYGYELTIKEPECPHV